MSTPLHQRVAAALDGAPSHLEGPELLRHIETAHAHDRELIEECRALLSAGTTSATLPGFAAGAGTASRAALERLHDRLLSRGTLTPTLDGDAAAAHATPREMPTTIGPYRILRQLGEGGMGVVYEAEQTSPKRRVAIKVIRAGTALRGERAARARFRNEAQALANLKHPGIAQIIEAHIDDADEPRAQGAAGVGAYFVMEFVEGPSLTAFAAAADFSTNERVELLAKVCDAVQHAHQKGVIHRDLKPANILVEHQPGSVPQPKVLDFGVAKLTQDDAPSATLAADAARIVGTLSYMSPEALDVGGPASVGGGGGTAVDTRTDVYALGVILYELLSGRLPVDVSGATITQAARRIHDQSPTPLAQHNPAFRGDLTLIAATALAKDREQRYASAAELAADLRRYLRHEPITARPPSTLYALGKFVRRRRALAAALGLAALSIIAGGVFSTVQYLRAERARVRQAELTALAETRLVEQEKATRRADAATDRAEAVKRYLVSDLIVSATPERLGADAKITDALDAAYAAVPDRFAQQPDLRAELLQEFSGAYNLLGRFEPALEAARRAADERAKALGESDERTIAARAQVAVVLNTASRFEESEPLLRTLVPTAEAHLPPEHPTRLRIAATWGNLLQSKGETDAAIAVLAPAADVAETALPISDGIRTSLRNNLAAAYMRAGKVPEAVDTLGKLIEEQQAAFSPTDPAVLATMNNHIVGLIRLKRYDEAVTKAEDLVARVDRSHPPKHPARGYAHTTLSVALQRTKQWDRARHHAEEGVRLLKESIDEAAWDVEQGARRLVDIELKSGRRDEARAWALEAQKIRCFTSGAGERDSLLKSFDDEGKRLTPDAPRQAAAGLLAELIAQSDQATPPGHPRRARYLANLARASVHLGDANAGTQMLETARASAPRPLDEALAALFEAVLAELPSAPK
ncbi:MAG: protein kinase domain-containing protein [Phycisphaerales bacterium]